MFHTTKKGAKVEDFFEVVLEQDKAAYARVLAKRSKMHLPEDSSEDVILGRICWCRPVAQSPPCHALDSACFMQMSVLSG